LPQPTVCGGGTGAERVENTLPALLYGRCVYPKLSTFQQLHEDVQLNDCWPVTSWSIVDYFLRPKPAYLAVARELRPNTVGMTRKEVKTFADERTAAFFTIEVELEIWGTNSTLSDKKCTLEVTCFDLHSDWRDQWRKEVVLASNASTELYKGRLPGQPTRNKDSETRKDIIASARLLDETGVVLGRHSNWYDCEIHGCTQLTSFAQA
jgi:beta-mannosidase